MTRAAGLPRYEVSNHARIGQESRHNLAYWRYADYAGVGPGAHGRRKSQATERHKKPENFIAAVARNGHGLKVETDLPAHERATEAMLMGLRLMYEPAIRVPMLLRWPGGLAAGRVDTRHFALNIDVAPTMLDLAGSAVPAAMQGAIGRT